MKWRGRRQSTNIIDLITAPKTISVDWYFDESYDPSAVIIDTDGTLYVAAQVVTSEMISSMTENFKIVCIASKEPIDEDDPPSLTSGQKNAIEMLIIEISKNANSGSVTLQEPRSDLQVNISEYVQSLLNNS